MIITEYKLSLTIDNENFRLSVREPNLAEKKELEDRAGASQKRLGEQTALSSAIATNERLITTNEALAKESGIIDRAKILLENKTLIRENAQLTKKLEELNLSDILDELEELFKNKAHLLIGGDDKEQLFDTMAKKGVKFESLWGEIAALLAKESEKK